ncbi:MAG: hypothetical protein JWM37_551 [Candidatus Saccharibacteria bacterium]|nr:hypothetical protein [Candidatus Saccharibacteria bacterium]
MALDTGIALPNSIVTATDLARMRLELERVNETMLQNRLREPKKTAGPPRVSQRLEQLFDLAGVKLTHEGDREQILKELNHLQKTAPKIKLSFATDPSDEFLAKIIGWFRQNIHPQVLMTVGLQPSIAAGFVMRTPSKYFDCSMRKHLNDHKGMLAEALQAAPEVKA